MPDIDPNNPPTIKIDDEACTNVRQDDYDNNTIYFTPPESAPGQQHDAGNVDIEISGITIPGVPFLSDGKPLKLENLIEYTDDVTKGIKGFSDAIGVSIKEAESMAKQKQEDEGLSAEDTADFFSSRLDGQSNQGMYLMKSFMDGKTVDSMALQKMEDTNASKFQTVLANVGFTPTGGGGDGSGGVTVNVTAIPPTSGGGNIGFAFTRSGNFNVPLTIDFSVSGSATNGVDYTAITTSIMIPAYQASGMLPITPTGSGSGKTIQITISASQSYQIDGQNSAQISIPCTEPLFKCLF